MDLSNSQTLLSQVNDAQHIFASVQEIAMRAGVEEDQVGTLLYYLEEQTTDTLKGQKVFERGTLVSNVWRLKFEKDYQARLNELPSSSSSWRLVHVFQNTDGGYLLNTSQFTTISARELADSLKLPLKDIETELTNLSKRRIVTYAGNGRFKFTSPMAMLSTRLKDIRDDLKKLLQVINKFSKTALERNELVTVNVRTIMSQKGIKTVTYAQVTKFLFTYAHENVEPMRLLERFNRVTRNGQPDTYEMQLWLKRNRGSVLKTIDDIIDQLDQTVKVLASKMADQANYNDWHAIDLFVADPDYSYDKRRKFHQNMLVLEALGLLQYISDTAMGQAMHMSLLQPPVVLEHLHINLDSLRLQEKHAKSKRKIMEQYASMTQKDLYAKQFAMYFQGAEPLIEQRQQELRQDLTPQQRQIATLKEGIHVIEGPAGCGKTATLAEHVKYLVNQGVPIDHILITTHYRSAEGHIADALKDLEGEGATAVSTTINAFGQKIFTQYRYLLLKPDGTPYYGGEQELKPLSSEKATEEELSFINQALKKMESLDFPKLINHDGWPWPQDLELPQFGPHYRSNAVEEDRFQAAIHRMRQCGIFPTQPPSKNELSKIIGEQTGAYSLAEYYAVYMIYVQAMAEKNMYTYDDQVTFALAILRTNPDVLRQYQRCFEHIIIDELQDFSPAKIELLLMLCEKHTNIMAFGDILQEILFDRIKTKNNGGGKDVKVSAKVVFDKLSEQESCGANQTHQLDVNFRSTQEILDLSTYLRNLGSQRSIQLQSGINKRGPKPVAIYTATNALEDLIEATLDQINYLLTAEKESIAIIFGDKTMLNPAQKLLRQRNIPFSLMDGQKALYQLHYVKNMLVYLYLIEDKKRDEEVERLLRYNIVPYFDKAQINSLKTLAHKTSVSLFEILSSPKHLQEAKITKAQQESLRHHLRIINDHQLEDPVNQLEQSLSTLSDGPLILLQEQEEKRKELDSILHDFNSMSIKEALEEIKRHITFLDEHRGRSDLVLATVNYSKSQEFETVFLLGIDKIFKERLYVSVSRAKQRLFFVGDEEAFAVCRDLSQVPEKIYERSIYPKKCDL
jgi:superfamily I DNA/RNA helicase